MDAGGADARPRAPLAAIWGAPTLADQNPDENIVEVSLTAERSKVSLDGKEIDVLAFNGSVPGPILQARPKQRVIVHFRNALDEFTTMHWHGLRIPAAMDGSPHVQTPIAPGATFTYDFVVPDAGSFWYHPHVQTHDQVERGLYGAIVVQGDDDPVYDLERSLTLDDVLLDEAGNIAPPTISPLTGLSGRWGKVLLTNGKNSKGVRGAARKGQVERWRIVNSANARRMALGAEGASFRVIGADAGLFADPFPLQDLLLPVGGRVELEVSYDRPGEAKLFIKDVDERFTMFTVDVADAPETPRAIPWPKLAPVVAERPVTSTFNMAFDFLQSGNSTQWFVNGVSDWKEPILTVKQGATVKIRLSNTTPGVEHPFHLHGQFFRVLDAKWPGLRDTVQVPALGAIEIVAYLDNPGLWMAHCHILEHAALGMMTDIEVLPTGAAAGTGAHGH